MIGRMFDLKAAEAATLADTLDGLSVGLFLVDSAARIVHCHTLPAMPCPMQRTSCAPPPAASSARDGQADRALREALAVAGEGDSALGTSRNRHSPLVGSTGERYVAHLLPLTSGARRQAGLVYFGHGGFVRAQGGYRRHLAARTHRQDIPAHRRASRPAGDRPGRRRAGDRCSARRRRNDDQDASQPSVLQNRNPAAGGSGQAVRRLCRRA